MSPETNERRQVKVGGGGDGHPPHQPEPDNLQCPRCESVNTKFCYYNNYNLSQPRYFCKSCRRYWTRGGSLRNIPVGGGTRKNSKRSRSSQSTAASAPPPPASQAPPPVPCSSALPDDSQNDTKLAPVLFSAKTETLDMNLNESLPGTFSSLLGSSPHQSGGFMGLGGYSLGLGPSSGFDMLGFGFGPAMVEMGSVNGGSNGVGGSSGGSSSGCNAWQMDGGADGGDCFAWPDLAISTPGTTAGLE